MRVVLLTRRFGGEATATTARLRAYVDAIRTEGAEVIVLTRFPFVYRGRTPDPAHVGRLYYREQIDRATVVRIRVPGEHGLFKQASRRAFGQRRAENCYAESGAEAGDNRDMARSMNCD